ncbi:MAG: UDP-N-acetylmuramoyl-tripeptide--D-alanyl-D-alanine ligase [Lentimicrobiaceae bacterium]|nr:UDP-N-acetylmuramoyl-tripeptide--D-alanyl-D-alanine ligase [Lentimicrobiaceae bacterium]
MFPISISIEELYSKFVQFPIICTDTRKIVPNSLFFCLKGEKFDGNLFVNEALKKGAKYVITEKNIQKTLFSKSNLSSEILVVDDVLQTLQQLALYHRKQLKIPIIGITGTNGKTTTKELMASVLSKKYKTAFTQGNLNNHIGVPLTILSIKNDDEIAIVEMGANHPGEIAELCQIAQPQYGLITNIGKAHLEGFGTIENIIETKTALYRAAQTLFVNNGEWKMENGEWKIVYYGKNTEISAEIVEMNPFLVIDLFSKKVQTQLTGNYNLSNILGAAAVGRYFNVSNDDICNAIAEYTPQNNRSQIIKKESNTIIADYYNANPTSMKAALENLLQIEAQNRLAILGDMLELGENSVSEHQAVIDFCKENNVETFFIGTHFYHLKNDSFKFFMNVEDCNNYLNNKKIENTFMLIKGSRGIALEHINLCEI